MNQIPVTTSPFSEPMSGDRQRRLFSRIGLFWCGVIVVLLLLGGAQAVSDQPAMLHNGNGLLTAVLIVAYVAWFVAAMRVWRWRRQERRWRVSARRAYPVLAAGIVLTAALVLLHPEFNLLFYVIVSVIFQMLEPRESIVSMAVVVPLFLYASGTFRSGLTAQLGSDLFTILVTIGLGYSIGSLMRGRVETERLLGELREAHDQLRLSAAREVELAALRERNRLAREMHDSLGHALVLIAIKIEAGQRLQVIDPTRATAEWEDTKALVRSTMGDLRASLAGLRPRALDEQSFHTALGELASELGRRTDIDVTATVSPDVDALDRTVQEALYRVAQEALANVAKHARAGHVALSLARHGRDVQLVVEDDGVGLDTAARSEGDHYGILGMRERVEAVSGVLTLGPRPGGGTCLRASVPLSILSKEETGVRDPDPVG